MKLYLDANVLIHAIEGGDTASEKLQAILDLAEDGGCGVVTSELSLAETIVGPLKRLKIEPDNGEALARERLYRSFGEGSGEVRMIPVDRATLFKAAELRAGSPSLKLPDSIHLATCLLTECDAFVSGDRRLAGVARGAVFVCSLDPAELGALSFRLGL